jgi:guanylate kinase
VADSPLLVVLTGPSGTGKDSILTALKRRRNSPYGFAVNVTTRPRREDERDGLDYYFVTPEEFERRRRDGELLEHAMVYGQHKGVLKSEIQRLLAAGRHALLRTDIQGARYIKSIAPATVTIFVAPPSREELERRLSFRGGDTPEQVALRLKTAIQEMDAAAKFDYTVINDDLERCVLEIEEIIARESSAAGRKPVEMT